MAKDDKGIMIIVGIIFLGVALFYMGAFNLLLFAIIEPGNYYSVEVNGSEILSSTKLNYDNENLIGTINVFDDIGDAKGTIVLEGNSAYDEEGNGFMYGMFNIDSELIGNGNYNGVCSIKDLNTRCMIGDGVNSKVILGRINFDYSGISISEVVDTDSINKFLEINEYIETAEGESYIFFGFEIIGGYSERFKVTNMDSIPNAYYEGACYIFNLKERGITEFDVNMENMICEGKIQQIITEPVETVTSGGGGGAPSTIRFCGDNTCDSPDETQENCPLDCGCSEGMVLENDICVKEKLDITQYWWVVLIIFGIGLIYYGAK